MPINSNNILLVLKNKLNNICLTESDLKPTKKEEEICEEVLNLITKLNDQHSFEIEQQHSLEVNEEFYDEACKEDFDPAGEIFEQLKFWPREFMHKIVAHWDDNPNWTLKTIQSKYPQVTSHSLISKFRKYLDNWGTSREKLLVINQYCYEQFKKTRSLGRPVHDHHIRLWALKKADEVRLDRSYFKASHRWIQKFKSRNRISSRSVTKFVTKQAMREEESVENDAIEFMLQFNE